MKVHHRSVFLRLILVLGIAALAVSGCDLFGSEDDDRGRIVLGERVDGLPLGADTLALRNVLGPPSQIDRLPGSLAFRYLHGRHAGMTIHYQVAANRTVDKTTLIALSAPYAGKTRGGVGLGSRRDAVLEELGLPDVTNEGNGGLLYERYRVGDANVNFLYDDEQRVLSLTMQGPMD